MNAPAATAPRNGARWLAHALEAEGVDTLFGYPGGTIMPFYDALVDSSLKHILVRHEQGAALAANGFARASNQVGVCVATSGPGASNLVTGIADAMLDSVPMVCITGQVGTPLLGTDAFQELDVFGLTMPIVKHSWLVRSVDDLPRVVADAFRIAREGRPGPVLIDLPKDVQLADASHLPAHVPSSVEPPPAPAEAASSRMAICDLEMDLISRKAWRAGQRLDLTAKEFSLLALLARRKGQILSRTTIAEQVWDMNFDSDTNVIEVAVRRLRSKMDDPFKPKLLHNVRGMGYVLEERT